MLSSLSELKRDPESSEDAEELDEDPSQSEPRISGQSSLLSELLDRSELTEELSEESSESVLDIMLTDRVSKVGARAVSSSLSSGDNPARAKTHREFFFQAQGLLDTCRMVVKKCFKHVARATLARRKVGHKRVEKKWLVNYVSYPHTGAYIWVADGLGKQVFISS
jgi:hypothetical protein